jgi:hypothetical protein
MYINKDIMAQQARNFLKVLFMLPEVEKVAIKDVVISSMEDGENIRQGLDLCYHDMYSDVDINAYLKLCPKDYHAETPVYKKHFYRLQLQDGIFGIAFVERVNDKEGMRICLDTGIRIDFTCFCRCDKDAAELPQLQSKDEVKLQSECCYEGKWGLDRANSFWFVAIQALGKLMRKDYLISSHLAHMLIQESLVVQMVMRDNQYNTNFHRYGYSEDLEYLLTEDNDSNIYMHPDDETYNHIVRLLYQAVVSFDRLILQLNRCYISKQTLFFEIWDCYDKDIVKT